MGGGGGWGRLPRRLRLVRKSSQVPTTMHSGAGEAPLSAKGGAEGQREDSGYSLAPDAVGPGCADSSPRRCLGGGMGGERRGGGTGR